MDLVVSTATTTQTVETLEVALEDNRCFCVMYLREEWGIPISGYAGDIQPNLVIEDALVGDVLLTDYGIGKAHVEVILDDLGDSWLVAGSNFKKCEEGQRVVSKYDQAVRGIYRAL